MVKSLSLSEHIFPLRSATSGRHVPFVPPPRIQTHSPATWASPTSIGTDFLPRSGLPVRSSGVSFTHQKFHPDFPQRELYPVVMEAVSVRIPLHLSKLPQRSAPPSPRFFPSRRPSTGTLPANLEAFWLRFRAQVCSQTSPIFILSTTLGSKISNFILHSSAPTTNKKHPTSFHQYSRQATRKITPFRNFLSKKEES